MMEKRKSILLFFALVFVLNTTITLVTYKSANHFLKDSYEYMWQRTNLSSGHSWYSADPSMEFDPQYVSYRPPGYGMMLFLIGKLHSGNLIILLIQSLISALSFTFIFQLLYESGFNHNSAVAVAVSIILFPAQLVYTNMIMSESVFQLFIVLTFYFLIAYIREQYLGAIIYMYISISVAVLIKPIVLYFFVPVLLLFWFQKRSGAKLSHYLPVLITVSVVLMVMTYNYNKTGYFHYSSIKQKYALNYLAFKSLEDAKGSKVAHERIDSINQEANSIGSFKEQVNYTNSASEKVVRDNLVSFLKLSVVGAGKFFIEPGRWAINGFLPQIKDSVLRDLYIALCFFWSILLIVGLVLFLQLKAVPIEARIAVLVFISYFVLITGMTGTARFRMPVYPIQVFAFVILLHNFRVSRHKKSVNP